jgi:hypothetical protein
MNNLLSKKIVIVILIAVLILLIFAIPKAKFIISRTILSHELSIVPNLVFKKINQNVEINIYKQENKKKSSIILAEYVFNHTMPIEQNLDDGASWKLLHGSIWCDGVSDIFNRLLEVNHTRSYLVFLYNDENVSPHTLNFVDFLDQPLINGRNASLNKRSLYMFDTQSNYMPINKKNALVDINYMINNNFEFKNMNKLDSNNIKLNLLKNDKAQLWDRNVFGKENSLIRNLSKKIARYTPNLVLEGLIKFAIYINPKLSQNYKDYLYVRLDHILLNYNDALEGYKKLKGKNIYLVEADAWIKKINEYNF